METGNLCEYKHQNIEWPPHKGELCMISGFHYEVGESCTLLGYYIASSGNLLTPEDGLTQNIGKKLPLLAA